MNNLPNVLTLFRFILIPIISFCLFKAQKTQSCYYISFVFGLFAIAAITDFLDGYLARKFKSESKFGEYFDNIADKMLNISVVCVLLYFRKIWLVPVVLVILREVFMPAFREYSSSCGYQLKVDVTGKIKTTFQFISILLFLFPVFQVKINIVANIFFFLTAFLSWTSVISYFIKFIKSQYAK